MRLYINCLKQQIQIDPKKEFCPTKIAVTTAIKTQATWSITGTTETANSDLNASHVVGVLAETKNTILYNRKLSGIDPLIY